MANVDVNSSGAIDYEEFLAATLHFSKVSSVEYLQRAFMEFDKDGSGMGRTLMFGMQCLQSIW
jgi:calcium-dependent protein kinase